MKYFFYRAIMGHFFCQKKSNCRDFCQKIDENPILHSNKYSKVKYLNSAYYMVLFFVLKIAKCRDFDQKINKDPLHIDKFSKVKYLNSAYTSSSFLCLKLPNVNIYFYFFIKVKYLFYQIMGHFFCQKKSKCRDFDQKINQTPLLHSDKSSKVKYLNSAY